MDRQAFKQRMQNLKSYRENNPGKGYWDWKVEAFADGGEINDKYQMKGYYSNHSGNPTMYVPITKQSEEINVYTPEVTVTPKDNISIEAAIDKGRKTAFENIKEAASYTPVVGDAMDVSDAVYQATQGNYGKAAILGGLALLPNVIQKPIQKFAKLFKLNKKPHNLDIDIIQSNNNKPIVKRKRKSIIQQQNNNILDTAEQNNDAIKSTGEFVDTRDFLHYSDEYNNRDYLFSPDYGDRLNELRQANERIPELQQQYQRMLTDPNFVDTSSIDELVRERNNLFDIGYNDIQYQFGMPELNQLSQPLRDLPFINRYELRSIALANSNRIHANDILNESVDILNSTDISQLQRVRDRLYDLDLDVGSQLEERVTDLYEQIEDRIAILYGTSTTRGNTTPLYNVSAQPYNKDNLPEFFYRDEALLGDRKNASYFNMSPKQAVEKATNDFNNLQHGQAWHLTDDYSVSTDSYPLQLNLMSKYKDSGKISAVHDSDGNVRTMYLNSFGNLKGDASVKRINKKIQNISEIIGEDLPKAVQNGHSIKVPQIYYRKYSDGGQTGDPEKERFYQATGRSSSGRPLEEGLKPVFSLEDAANMTPIGDAISARDTYNAVKNRDWLGAGLAAVTMIPFVPTTVRNFRKKYKGVTPKREIPTVNKKAIDNAIDEAKNYRDSRIKLYQQAIEDRNASYERLIENEDALRRAVNFDKKYGTNYVKTYTKQLQNYAKSKNSPDLMQIGIKPMGANGSFDPNIPDYVFINSDYVKNGKLQPGLISHEKSHYDNQKAGALSLPIFDNRFVDTKKTKTMYPKTYDWIQRYLHNFEETKSHMNEFRTNMINKNLLKPDSKVGLKQIKDLIFNSDNDNMKKLFNTYKSKRQFVKDFNSVPITSIGDNKTLV